MVINGEAFGCQLGQIAGAGMHVEDATAIHALEMVMMAVAD